MQRSNTHPPTQTPQTLALFKSCYTQESMQVGELKVRLVTFLHKRCIIELVERSMDEHSSEVYKRPRPTNSTINSLHTSIINRNGVGISWRQQGRQRQRHKSRSMQPHARRYVKPVSDAFWEIDRNLPAKPCWPKLQEEGLTPELAGHSSLLLRVL